jgi:hypothetical protein
MFSCSNLIFFVRFVYFVHFVALTWRQRGPGGASFPQIEPSQT